MASTSIDNDQKAFGQLVRGRRLALGLTQEALALEALGNPDRKSFVSAIENNRVHRITPNTAQRLSGPLGLTAPDVPASLRWHMLGDLPPTEERLQALEAQQRLRSQTLDDAIIAQFLNRQMAEVLGRSLSDAFLQRLKSGLDGLQRWTGAPFSLQSLMTCYALSMFYLVVAGLIGFWQGDIVVGSIRPFETRPWVGVFWGAVLPYIALPFLLVAFACCVYVVRAFGRSPMGEKEATARLGGVALIGGLACGLVDYAGAKTMIAAAIFALPGVGAISTLEPNRSALYGAAGGIMFGLTAAIGSGLSDYGVFAFLTSLIEGFIIGGLVGAFAGLVSSLIANRVPYLRPGQLAAAGGGIGAGALAALAGIVVAMKFTAISDGMLGLFAISWLALPLANTVLDYVSLGVSHALGRYVVRRGAHTASVLAVMIVDLLLALAFMVLTVIVVGVSLQAISWGLDIETLSATFLRTSAEDPWGQGLWLTFMALTTTVWTLLHFGLVVAPLVAGTLTRRLLVAPAAESIADARNARNIEISLGFLVSLKFFVFFASWASVALLPLMILVTFPHIMETVLWLGWQATELLN